MLFNDDRMILDAALQKRDALQREAGVERMAVRLGPSRLTLAINRIGKMLVSLGEELQRRHPGVMTEASMKFRVDVLSGKG